MGGLNLMALDLIAPEVPDAQKNLGASLFLQGAHTGLAAAAQFAEQRRQSENEMLKLATEERIAQDQHAFEREKLYKDSEVQDALTKAHAEYYKTMGDAAMMKANAYVKGASNVVAFNQQRQDLVNEVNAESDKLQLNDPSFATKEPIKFAANVMQFKDMFGLSPLPEVKSAVQKYQAIADQQKIPLKLGATYDEEQAKWVGGEEKMVPIWQVVSNLQDPLRKDDTTAALHASGHFKTSEVTVPGQATKSWKRPIDSLWDMINGPTPQKRSVEGPDSTLSTIMKQGEGVQFQHVPSKVPAAMLPKSYGKGTDGPTQLPEPDLPADGTSDPQASNSGFQPTDTDVILGHAKAALANGAPREAVVARLQQLGIDPGSLAA